MNGFLNGTSIAYFSVLNFLFSLIFLVDRLRIGLITDNGWVRVVLPSSLSRYVYSLVEFERRVPILNPKLALETIYLAVKKEEEEEEKVREIMEVMRDPIVLGEIFSNTIPGRFEEKAVLKEELYRLLFEVLETFS
ncbi:MAG: hypothetical protein B6U76_01425, partial [Desulfurococcales archaeon ex4484_217_2]